MSKVQYGLGGAEVARPRRGAVRCGRVATDRITDVACDVPQVRILPQANHITPPQIAPAETLQADEPEPAPRISIRFGIALALFSALLMGAHVVWAASGMPTADNFSPVMEMLNV